MLVERLERFDVPVWLVNTGWTGGPYGTGHRMNIDHTRTMVRRPSTASSRAIETVVDPIFRVAVPVRVPGIPDEVLVPRSTWPDAAAYDAAARQLAAHVPRQLREVRGRRGRVDPHGRPRPGRRRPRRRGLRPAASAPDRAPRHHEHQRPREAQGGRHAHGSQQGHRHRRRQRRRDDRPAHRRGRPRRRRPRRHRRGPAPGQGPRPGRGRPGRRPRRADHRAPTTTRPPRARTSSS